MAIKDLNSSIGEVETASLDLTFIRSAKVFKILLFYWKVIMEKSLEGILLMSMISSTKIEDNFMMRMLFCFPLHPSLSTKLLDQKMPLSHTLIRLLFLEQVILIYGSRMNLMWSNLGTINLEPVIKSHKEFKKELNHTTTVLLVKVLI